MKVADEYLKVIQGRFIAVKAQGGNTLNQLNDHDIHWTFNNTSNSIVVIVKHVSGNMISRWTDFLITDGEKDTRKRDEEFIDDIASHSELISIWEKGWDVLFTTIQNLTSDDLLKEVKIRGEKHTVIDAIERQLSHYSSHVGQIIYIAKLMRGTDWKTLSIPIGKSEEFLQEKLEDNQ